MKKIKLLIMLMLIIVVSCKKGENYNVEDSNIDTISKTNLSKIDSDDADSVNLLKLETECDCIDAGLIVAKELISYDNKKLTSIQQDRVNELKIKLKKIIKLSQELGSMQEEIEPNKDGGVGRYKWSYFSCKNFKEFDRISPMHYDKEDPGPVADTTQVFPVQ
jgi:hypothetical protein